MSKLYKLTKQTNQLVKELAKQEEIEIEIDTDFLIDEFGNHHFCGYSLLNELKDYTWTTPLIEAPQICQILKAFEEIINLGIYIVNSQISHLWGHNTKDLCQKWLNYRQDYTRMIDSKPERVLEELNQILKKSLTIK